ncbi:MAG TPA: hypothetical protein ENI61_00670 [Ignavibacteria bacterium]|nr:hypothetical protein [Ignavibacteria bacterium]
MYNIKVKEIANKITKNKNIIYDQKRTNSNIIKNINLIAPNHYIFKTIRNKTSDWKQMEILDQYHWVSGELIIDELDFSNQYISWEIKLKQFPETSIPFITTEMLIRPMKDNINDNAGSEDLFKTVSFHIKDTENPNIKIVTIIASLWFAEKTINRNERYKIKPQEAKLIVEIINPT